jgi:hypothetical protein
MEEKRDNDGMKSSCIVSSTVLYSAGKYGIRERERKA